MVVVMSPNNHCLPPHSGTGLILGNLDGNFSEPCKVCNVSKGDGLAWWLIVGHCGKEDGLRYSISSPRPVPLWACWGEGPRACVSMLRGGPHALCEHAEGMAPGLLRCTCQNPKFTKEHLTSDSCPVVIIKQTPGSSDCLRRCKSQPRKEKEISQEFYEHCHNVIWMKISRMFGMVKYQEK